MSKELEALERLKTAPSFMGGTVEYQACTQSEALLMQDYEIVKQALKRLEAIDNSNPSEALECLDKVYSRLPQWDLSRNTDQCNIIKQALLKAQEPKQYLKWEDLIFSKEPIYIKATLNSIRVTIKCWKEYMKEWCSVDFNNAPCNNMMFVHHGYDDDTDTQPNLFDALGFVRI